MNEELKIIIKAVTDSAKKSIQEVRGELEAVGASAKSSSEKSGKAMKGIAKGAAVAIAAITAVTAAIVALGKKSLELIKEHSKLIASFQSVGASAKTAETTYKGLYRFLGDKGKATEAAAHLALIARNQEQLADWTKITQGVYARFGDSIPIEGLTEAANETLRVGKVTGNLADALNWAGVSEDEFNEKLALTTSYEQREELLRRTLNDLYGEAAELYEKNNEALLEHNESQAKVEKSLTRTGAVITPLLTALNNLSAALLDALKPALDVIIPALTTVVNGFTKAVQAVTSFFAAITGESTSISASAKSLTSTVTTTDKLGSGMKDVEDNAEDAAKAIEKVKRATLGFDELNIVPNNEKDKEKEKEKEPAYANPFTGFDDTEQFNTTVQKTEKNTNNIFDKIKEWLKDLAKLFAPAISAWKNAIEQIKGAWQEAKPHFMNGAKDIADAFRTLATYIATDFVPAVVNSFSENIVPIIADLVSFWLVEMGKQFEWAGGVIKNVTNDMIIPTLESMKMVTTDVFEIIGNTWQEFGDSLLEKTSTMLENLRGHFDNLYNKIFKPAFDMVKQKFDEVWTNKIKPLLQEISDSLAGIGEDLLILYNDVIAPVANWIIDIIAPHVLEALDMITDAFYDAWETISSVIAGIVLRLEGLIGFITGVFTGDWEKAWDGLVDYFKGAWDTKVSIFKGAWELIKAAFKPAVDFFKNIWKDIKSVFSDPKAFFKQKFTDAVTAIKNVFNPLGDYFGGLWNTIKKKFSTLGTSIGNAIGDAVKSGINGVISMIENTINSAISIINGGIDLINKIPGVYVDYVSQLSLPRLAKGGIANAATTAVIGEAGREAVLPLDNNTEWMDKLADRIAARNSSPSKIVLQIGEKELGWATIKAINGITSQTGELQLAL